MSLGIMMVPMKSMKMTSLPLKRKKEKANAAMEAVMIRTTLETPAMISELSIKRPRVVRVRAIL